MDTEHNSIPSPLGDTRQARPARRWARRVVLLLMVVVVGVALLTTTLPDLPTAQAQATQPTEALYAILLGANESGSVPLELVEDANGRYRARELLVKLAFRDEDILAYHPGTNSYSVFFNGEARGLQSADVEDFEYLAAEDKLIFTLDKPFRIPNPNSDSAEDIDPLIVDDSDIVAWHRATDSFSIYKNGADFGFTTASEDIDALGITDEGLLLISTIGTARVNGPGEAEDEDAEVTARDEDLLLCDPDANTCILYFDGSEVDFGAGNEDVDAVGLDTSVDGDSNLYLSTKSKYKVEGSENELDGNKTEVFICTPLNSDPITDCFFAKFFRGDQVEYKRGVDGVAVLPEPLAPPEIVAAAPSAGGDERPSDPVDLAEANEAMSLGDPEIDVYDFYDVIELFLPMVSR